MKAERALDVLRFTPKRGAAYVSKVLKSAMANADEKEADLDRLYVVEARVDEGPRMKRVSPKDRGKAYMIVKQMSHIIITVDVK
jgi:large subunit ribosomal protein L22